MVSYGCLACFPIYICFNIYIYIVFIIYYVIYIYIYVLVMAIGARWSLSLNMYPYCIESLDMCFIYGTWCKDGIVNRTKVCVVLYYYLWEKTFQDWTDGTSCVIASTYIKILIRNHLNRKFSALPIFSSVISVWPKKNKPKQKQKSS